MIWGCTPCSAYGFASLRNSTARRTTLVVPSPTFMEMVRGETIDKGEKARGAKGNGYEDDVRCKLQSRIGVDMMQDRE